VRSNKIGVWYFADDGAQGATGGGSTSGATGGGTAPASTPLQQQVQLDREVERAVARYGSADAAIRKLMSENFKLRNYRRLATGQLTAKEIAPMLPEGLTLLEKDEAKQYDEFRKLNLKPAEVAARIKDADALAVKVEQAEREALHREAAELVSFNAKVLSRLAGSENMHIEIRDEHEDGKAVRKPYARRADAATDPLVPLSEYVEAQLGDFLPSLRVEQQGGPDAGAMRFPAQQPTGSKPPAGGSLVDRFITQKKEAAAKRNNPLAPQMSK
jgi:hypothetical protein